MTDPTSQAPAQQKPGPAPAEPQTEQKSPASAEPPKASAPAEPPNRSAPAEPPKASAPAAPPTAEEAAAKPGTPADKTPAETKAEPVSKTADIVAGPGGVMTDEVGVITGELTLRTEVSGDKVTVRVQYKDADEWYVVTGGKATLKDPADVDAVHKIVDRHPQPPGRLTAATGLGDSARDARAEVAADGTSTPRR